MKKMILLLPILFSGSCVTALQKDLHTAQMKTLDAMEAHVHQVETLVDATEDLNDKYTKFFSDKAQEKWDNWKKSKTNPKTGRMESIDVNGNVVPILLADLEEEMKALKDADDSIADVKAANKKVINNTRQADAKAMVLIPILRKAQVDGEQALESAQSFWDSVILGTGTFAGGFFTGIPVTHLLVK